MIVGGAGYFGARLAEALSADAEITVTCRGMSASREAWVNRSGVKCVRFDSMESSRLDVDGEFTAIINLAMPGMAEAARDQAAGMKKAASTVRACLDLLHQGRAQRLLHFSTFHVYGGAGRACYSEDDPPTPISPYGQVHLEGERLVLSSERTQVLRPTNMVGRPAHAELGDQARMLFLDLCRQAATGKMKLNNDGLSHRDFMPFGDGISAAKLLLNAGLGHERLFNVARGSSISLKEAALLIQEASGGQIEIEFGDGTDAYRMPFTVDTSRLRRLGWEPRHSLLEEAMGLVRFFK